MTLLTRLKADTLAARKAKAPQAGVLRTVLGTLDTQSKQKGTTLDDTLALAVIRQTLKGLEDTLTHTKDRPEMHAQVTIEIAALTVYLPTQMDESALEAVVRQAYEAGHTNIGSLMAYLKTHHAGQYDGKLASATVKSVLASA